MIIILEGRDGVGKTTLARELTTRLRTVDRHGFYQPGYIHFADRWSHADWIDNEVAADVLVATGPVARTIIYDRAIISGVAFSGKWDTREAAVMHAWAWFHRLLGAGHDIALVHLEAPSELRKERDPEALEHDARMLWDVDDLTRCVGHLLEGDRYFAFNTELFAVGDMARILIARLKRAL